MTDKTATTASFPEFVWIWNRVQGQGTPALHCAITGWLQRRWLAGDRDLLLMAFRNSGKSTLVGLFSAWLLRGNPDLRIMVLAADYALARKMVRNVKRVIERHPLTAGLKPPRADQWASDQFTVNRAGELRDPSMLAKGIGANVTGSRADVVICDDVEVPNTCDTPDKREDLRARLDEIEYVLVPGGLQLYVGTPHSYYSIYGAVRREDSGEQRPYLDGFKRLELAVVDGQGNSRWPQRFTPEKIDAIRRRTGPNKFASQMLLRPVNVADGRLDPDKLVSYGDDLDFRQANGEAMLFLGARRLVSASCWWDPAFGRPDGGDASVVAAVFADDGGHYWLHRIAYLETAAGGETAEVTRQCRRVAEFARDLRLPAVSVETNGLGRFLPGLLRSEIAGAGGGTAVIEAASARAKDLRIIDAFDAVLADGRLHAHLSVWDTPFIAEMREWRPAGRGRDDGLDAVSGCLLSEPVRLPRNNEVFTDIGKKHGKWRKYNRIYKANSDFCI